MKGVLLRAMTAGVDVHSFLKAVEDEIADATVGAMNMQPHHSFPASNGLDGWVSTNMNSDDLHNPIPITRQLPHMGKMV